jgi:acetyl esterase/lipase
MQAVVALAIGSISALAQGGQVAPAGVPGGVVALLWPAGAPGAQGSTPADQPKLTAFLPATNPTKTAVVIAPGGGYQHLAMDKEGFDVARWLNARGVAAFVLEYRLGPKYHHPVELGDAQRAIRTVRARASEYGVAIDHIGMWGFSAGGHLTATAGTHFDAGDPSAADPIERVSCRPDFLVLAYAVITLEDPSVHKGSLKYLLGDNPDPGLVGLLSNEQQVTPQTPPTFLFATTDDPVVPVMNSVSFYAALVRAKVPAEMHLFLHGPHGVGLAQGFPDLKGWPDLLARWMTARGLM